MTEARRANELLYDFEAALRLLDGELRALGAADAGARIDEDAGGRDDATRPPLVLAREAVRRAMVEVRLHRIAGEQSKAAGVDEGDDIHLLRLLEGELARLAGEPESRACA